MMTQVMRIELQAFSQALTPCVSPSAHKRRHHYGPMDRNAPSDERKHHPTRPVHCFGVAAVVLLNAGSDPIRPTKYKQYSKRITV